MPLYFFSLTDDPSARHSSEELPNNQAAVDHARKVEGELNQNSNANHRVRVFTTDGKRVD